MVAAVGQQRRLQRDAGLRGLDHEQAQAFACVLRIINTRHNDEPGRADAVNDKPFLAVQHPAVALRIAPGTGLDALGVVAALLVQRQGQALLAVHQSGQPALALLFAASGQQQLAAQHHRRQQRQRCQRAAHRLKDCAQAGVAHAQPVVFLGKDGGRPAQVNHLLPQRRVITQ